MIKMDTKVENINGIAKQITPQLHKLGIYDVRDLLGYWPYRFEDWSRVKNIAELEAETTATIKGKVELIENKRSKWQKKMITEAIIADETDSIKIVWFYQPYLTKNLHIGDDILVFGKVETRGGIMQFTHPKYEKTKAEGGEGAKILPVYSLTKRITSKQIRYLTKSALPALSGEKDWLPKSFRDEYKLLEIDQATREMHFPTSAQKLEEARRRIKFDELFSVQLRAEMSKQFLKQEKADSVPFQKEKIKKFVDSLPFQLTDAQRVASWEALQDMEQKSPMNRMVEGDVGSGKTMVATIAILNTIVNKKQVAYMMPTEILARQQYENLVNIFAKYDIAIALLVGAEAKTNKEEKITKANLKKKITKGEIKLVIGTHALIQDSVEYENLALAIIDEQHRFGVGQRKKLRDKNKHLGTTPHLLSMTATPIPRSLMLTVYGDLDLSIIDEMPKGRKEIETRLVMPEKRNEAYEAINEEIKKGRQVFIVCPLIDPSDNFGARAVKDEYKKINEKIFPGLRVGLLHGKMKPAEKEKIMNEFAEHKLDILVSTPVIEVGINIPNASIIMIESAERFGLAQLHQLRGRVGRGDHKSYCFLLTESDSEETKKRMIAISQCKNGFDLAEKDLEFRGPGEVYGIKQTGHKDGLKIAKLTDYIVIKQSKNAVLSIMKADPSLDKFPLIKDKIARFEEKIHME